VSNIGRAVEEVEVALLSVDTSVDEIVPQDQIIDSIKELRKSRSRMHNATHSGHEQKGNLNTESALKNI